MRNIEDFYRMTKDEYLSILTAVQCREDCPSEIVIFISDRVLAWSKRVEEETASWVRP